jgi:arylsulfatase A-like enzyme
MVALLLLCGCAGQTVAADGRPNIVLILIDDMPWYGTPVPMDDQIPGSCMAFRRMPNLEKLASQGMRFRNAYSAAPICGPSRCCIQTGMTTARSGFSLTGGAGPWPEPDPGVVWEKKAAVKFNRLIVPQSVKDIQPQWTTIAEALKPLGYTSAHFGKWHDWGGGPGEHGYDVHDGPTDNKDGNKRIENDPKRIFSLTERATKFMADQVQANRPFYLQLSHYAQHAGAEYLPKTLAGYENDGRIAKAPDKKEREHAAQWAAMDEDLDASLGTLLAKIEALGIAGNTYIFFTSDNGYRHWNEGLDPLRGAKWWLWESGVRVPLFVRGPSIPASVRCDTNVVGYDFLPTFLDLAGGDPAALKNIDGTSLKPLLLGKEATETLKNRALYFHYPHYRTSAPHSAMIRGEWKVLHFYDTPDEQLLFRLSTDLAEKNSLAGAEPERWTQMHKELMDYLAGVGARMPKPNPAYNPQKLAEQQAAEKGSKKKAKEDEE